MSGKRKMKKEYEEGGTAAESNRFSSSLTTKNIKVNSEYSKLVNPLSNLEYKLLKESINNKGLHLPIIVNQDNVILDGHNRYKICKDNIVLVYNYW